MRMIPMRKLFKKWPKWLIKWVSVMRLPGSNCLRLNYLLILSKMEKSRKRKQINKKLCSKICLIISRRSMMSRSKMHQKLNRKRKIKGNWRFRNFRKGLKLFKGSMKKLARSRSRNSKKTKCWSINWASISLILLHQNHWLKLNSRKSPLKSKFRWPLSSKRLRWWTHSRAWGRKLRTRWKVDENLTKSWIKGWK